MKYIIYLGILELFFVFGPSDNKAKLELSEEAKILKLDLEILEQHSSKYMNLQIQNNMMKEYLFGRYIWKTADDGNHLTIVQKFMNNLDNIQQLDDLII